jgi:hypothetical protein
LHQRRVPRCEQRADTNGVLAHDRDDLTRRAEKRLPVDEGALLAVFDRAGEKVAVVGGARHVAFGGLAEGFPGVARFQPREFFAVLDQ